VGRPFPQLSHPIFQAAPSRKCSLAYALRHSLEQNRPLRKWRLVRNFRRHCRHVRTVILKQPHEPLSSLLTGTGSFHARHTKRSSRAYVAEDKSRMLGISKRFPTLICIATIIGATCETTLTAITQAPTHPCLNFNPTIVESEAVVEAASKASRGRWRVACPRKNTDELYGA